MDSSIVFKNDTSIGYNNINDELQYNYRLLKYLLVISRASYVRYGFLHEKVWGFI